MPTQEFDRKATAFLVLCDGKALFYLRQGEDFAQTWDCGGSARNENEGLEDSLQRLLMETYCIDEGDYEYVASMAPTYFTTTRQDGKIKWRITLCLVKIDDLDLPKVGKPYRMVELKWFSIHELPYEDMHGGAKRDIIHFHDFIVLAMGTH